MSLSLRKACRKGEFEGNINLFPFDIKRRNWDLILYDAKCQYTLMLKRSLKLCFIQRLWYRLWEGTHWEIIISLANSLTNWI
jgi:hypothetical protein